MYTFVEICIMSEVSRVISARVPVDVAEMFEKVCKANGVTVSSGFKNMLFKQSTEVMTGNGVVDNANIPDDLSALLIGIGGLVIGTMVYATLNEHLPNDGRIDPELRKVICFTCAVLAAGGMAYGLHKMMKK